MPPGAAPLVVVGLGNPGERYADTRHNVGFMVVDALAHRLGVQTRKKLFHSYSVGKGSHEGRAFYLVKPLTYMNSSGRAVREALRDTGSTPGNLCVVCDSLDLSPGNLRVKPGGSSAGQKGLQSIIESIGTEEFTRIWIGIGRPAHKGQVVSHVLGSVRSAESDLVDGAVARAAEAVLLLLSESPQVVMNRFNRREPPA
jgi:PTH1 family peptidyl-tRNA hydrolase